MNHHRRSAQVWHVFSRDLTVLHAHPHVHPHSEWAIPAFAFLPSYSWYSFTDPEGWKAELAWVAGYLVRQFTCPKAVIHPTTSINRAQCRATGLIETNALPLHYTAIVSRCQNACPILGCTAAGDDGEDVVDKRSSYRLTRKDAVKSQLKK